MADLRANGSGTDTAPRPDEDVSVQDLAADTLHLLRSLRSASGAWEEQLSAAMCRNPYATLGAAAGVGYVLAGGLAPAAVRVAVSAGWRLGAAALLRSLIDAPQSGDE